jgi:hypothetical protein
MLYRAPRLSLLKLIRTAASRVIGALLDGRRSAIDTSLLQGVPEHHLRDLGLRRDVDAHFRTASFR